VYGRSPRTASPSKQWSGSGGYRVGDRHQLGQPSAPCPVREATGEVPEIAWRGGLDERQRAVSLKQTFGLVKVSRLTEARRVVSIGLELVDRPRDPR
jgi:hypothetical protein